MTRIRVLALGVAAVGLSACGLSGLGFVQDDRVDILRPDDRSEVTLPVTVSWSVNEFDGAFAVFVDRTPPPPGRTVEWLFRNDDSCDPSAGCPDVERLARSNIYVTHDTEVVIPRVPRRTSNDSGLHEIIVVLLDDHGRRIGESAFSVEVRVDREVGQ